MIIHYLKRNKMNRNLYYFAVVRRENFANRFPWYSVTRFTFRGRFPNESKKGIGKLHWCYGEVDCRSWSRWAWSVSWQSFGAIGRNSGKSGSDQEDAKQQRSLSIWRNVEGLRCAHWCNQSSYLQFTIAFIFFMFCFLHTALFHRMFFTRE